MYKLNGALGKNDLRRAFVDGAKWWEYHKGDATMWQRDRNLAEIEAERRWRASQQSVFLTALGIGILAFFIGFSVCWLIFIH